MRRPRAIELLTLAACATLVAGCSSTRTVPTDRTLQLAVTEYRVVPQSIRMSQGGVTIYVHNYGRLTHNLVITSGGHTTGSTKPIWPGGTASLFLYVSPGTYSISSTLSSDQALGVDGTLTVTR